jgi:alpha-ketoglutarate-dependent taurine dioxygenase
MTISGDFTVQNKMDYPYIWNAAGADIDQFAAFTKEHAAEIDERLLKHGAILFRGFGVDSADKMRRCIDSLPGKSLRYVDGNSPRTHVHDAVYTSTEYPPELSISLHSELSYAHRWPAHLYFCCAIEPQQGGNTLIACNRNILRDLPADLVKLFKEKGIKYVRNLHDDAGVKIGQSWRATYETTDRSVVERHCKDNDIQYVWKDDGSLRTVQIRKAIVEHPVTGEEVWFNQADQFHPSTNPPEIYDVIMELFGDNPIDMPHYACFADDTPIDTDMLNTVREVARKHTAYFPWKTGDLLMVDNVLVSHGRAPFSGPRKILVAMSG